MSRTSVVVEADESGHRANPRPPVGGADAVLLQAEREDLLREQVNRIPRRRDMLNVAARPEIT